MIQIMFAGVAVALETSAKSHKSMLLRQRQVWNKVNFMLMCLPENCHFHVKMFTGGVASKRSLQLYFAPVFSLGSVHSRLPLVS